MYVSMAYKVREIIIIISTGKKEVCFWNKFTSIRLRVKLKFIIILFKENHAWSDLE
jgi:hypothetical protein